MAQYLTFNLEEEEYAVNVVKVREVLEFTSITKVPKSPDFMRGVINLRGGVVPVIDLRLKFNMLETERTVDTCIIVMEINFDDDIIQVGALADSVHEVIELEPSDIEEAPKIGTKIEANFISGMGKKDDKFIIILDIDKIFSTSELLIAQELGEPVG